MNAFLPTFTILDAGYSQGSSGGQSTGGSGDTNASYSNSLGQLCIWFADGASGAGWYILDEETGGPGEFVSSTEPGGDWVLNP